MSVQGLMLFLACGAALIAVWLDVRVRRPQPRSMLATFTNLGLAFSVLFVLPVPISVVVGGSDSAARKMAALFLVALPAFVYAFLSIVWFFRMAQSMMRFR